ncbi:hypothetical protein, partial [Klebsiella pneumoniae]|uniref:hypothetical protein n=1 Tax=Klebsiella pneumoniae TaxID=573 RepID=UPI001C7D2282
LTTASFVSGEYFGLAIKLHLTQLGVQLLGCSPVAPPGKGSGCGAGFVPGGGCDLPGLRSVRLVVNLFTIVAETAGVAASKSLRRSRKAGAARMDAG